MREPRELDEWSRSASTREARRPARRESSGGPGQRLKTQGIASFSGAFTRAERSPSESLSSRITSALIAARRADSGRWKGSAERMNARGLASFEVSSCRRGTSRAPEKGRARAAAVRGGPAR